MTVKTINRMSEKGALETHNDICDGLKDFFKNNPEGVKEFLALFVTEVLEPLAAEDFFGTEGWEHGVGLD